MKLGEKGIGFGNTNRPADRYRSMQVDYQEIKRSGVGAWFTRVSSTCRVRRAHSLIYGNSHAFRRLHYIKHRDRRLAYVVKPGLRLEGHDA